MKCAFDRDGKCSALKEQDCRNCSFRKTKDQLEAGRKKARQRIASLPADISIWIIDKYYLKQTNERD